MNRRRLALVSVLALAVLGLWWLTPADEPGPTPAPASTPSTDVPAAPALAPVLSHAPALGPAASPEEAAAHVSADLADVADALGLETATCSLSEELQAMLGPRPMVVGVHVLEPAFAKVHGELLGTDRIQFVVPPDADVLELNVSAARVGSLEAYRVGPGLFACSEPSTTAHVRVRLSGPPALCDRVNSGIIRFGGSGVVYGMDCGTTREVTYQVKRDVQGLFDDPWSTLIIGTDYDPSQERVSWTRTVAEACTMDIGEQEVHLDCHVDLAEAPDGEGDVHPGMAAMEARAEALLAEAMDEAEQQEPCDDEACWQEALDDLWSRAEVAFAEDRVPAEVGTWNDRRAAWAHDLLWPPGGPQVHDGALWLRMIEVAADEGDLDVDETQLDAWRARLRLWQGWYDGAQAYDRQPSAEHAEPG